MNSNDFFIESPAFAEGDEIPDQYTAMGSNMSPPLEWSQIPPHAKEFVIICEDPDARRRPFVHWIVYNIPATMFELREGLPTIETLQSGITQGMNSSGHVGYLGPKPPPTTGHHRYYFRIFALDRKMKLPPGLSYDQVMERICDHIDAEAECMGKAWYH